MSISTVKFAACALLAGLAGAVAAQHGPVGKAAAPGDDLVAKKALELVGQVHGTWPQMPGDIVTTRMNRGALIGNGSVGVALGGTAEKQQFYFGREDFWSVLRGSIMPMGQVQLLIPALQGGSGQLSEDIAPAEVAGRFAAGGVALGTRSWVAAESNTLFVELENTGGMPVQVSALTLDSYGQKSRETLGGVSGNVSWLRVSPEVVRASIGGLLPPLAGQGGFGGVRVPPPPDLQLSDAKVRSIQVFDTATVAAGKPRYQWSAPDALAGGGTTPHAFACGDLLMPQRRFTVRGSIYLARPDGSGVLFNALAEHRWMQQAPDPANPLGNIRGHDTPRAQGAEAGLELYLAHGKLAANLNGTVVASKQEIPLRRWVDVEVAYDGTSMTLRLDALAAGETSGFPSAAEVMGPKFSWMASHPGGAGIPFDGMAPEGVLATRVIGAKATEADGEMRFEVPAGGHVVVAVAASDNRDSADYFQTSIAALQQADDASVSAYHARHLTWWRSFWSKSFIEIPDKTVQAWWYGSLYVLASASRNGNVAPGLWGNWITSTHPGWDGDYTLDYNYQAPFWAAFPTNHVDLADPYDAPLLAWMERGKALAKQLNSHVLVYYTHLAPSPGWSADNFRALDQKSDALFAAVNCIQRWRYTRDTAYARKVWPFLVGVADFWDHDLKLVDGRYVDVQDAEDEHLWGPADDVNPATVIGFLNMLYPALIDMSHQLHLGSEMQPVWGNVLAHLSPLPLAPASSVAAIREAVGKPIPPGSMVIKESEKGMEWVTINRGDRFSADPPVAIQGSSAGMNSLQVVFPAWNVGLESSAALRQAAVNTVDYTRLWYDSNNTSNFYPAAANAGYDPDSILEHMHLMVTHLGYPNFAYRFDAGGVENEATVPTTVAAMLLQSYQKNIHVFPNWPVAQKASFGNLLAVGKFLVSGTLAHGQVGEVRIVSLLGGTCNLANPWAAGRAVRVVHADGTSEMLQGAVLTVETKAGDTLVFSAAAAN